MKEETFSAVKEVLLNCAKEKKALNNDYERETSATINEKRVVVEGKDNSKKYSENEEKKDILEWTLNMTQEKTNKLKVAKYIMKI